MSKFWMQTQAPAGNWSDVLGSDTIETCISQAAFELNRGKGARVVQRVDTVMWPEPQPVVLRWDTPPHGKGSRICDVNGHRLYVRRTAKGSRSFTGLIDGLTVGSWDTIEMAMSQTAKLARERGILGASDASNTSTQP